MSPSRFNIIPDFLGILLSVYINNWTMALWFAFAAPVNLGYQMYYMIDPLADMPPFEIVENGQRSKYDDVVG